MRILNGLELAGFIKERQAREVRALRQAAKIIPKLAIVRTNPAPVVDAYMRLKRHYGEDILVEVDVHETGQTTAIELIKKLNADTSVHGIIVQLPIPDPAQTDDIVNTVSPQKDVDGLGKNPAFDPATPMAINWLLAGYNIELKGKRIIIVGKGRLVGSPLAKMWRNSGLDVEIADRSTADFAGTLRAADVIVSAAGKPELITSDMIKPGAVVVDAGVATDKNGLVGDVSSSARERSDLTITPVKGGVGPLTVCALFENVIQAARRSASS
ncbi:MAG TPA: bifunctional 5,10-methylenetetrahydrofolate dehydrogenase/5,10-methenyltetrahydrofolate cyclohydrolase [Candidatus Acidoferrum sp.]|nr:bifunctional 5,10-methylenetetrahydrofolate dehydrogenase/5,10-methenyltetrahydrofolate cyclohydrolase [Candidatus Acidoferrum sp.]